MPLGDAGGGDGLADGTIGGLPNASERLDLVIQGKIGGFCGATYAGVCVEAGQIEFKENRHMAQIENAQSVALQLEKVRDKLPLLSERGEMRFISGW